MNQANLYIKCPNIIASMYAQRQLRDKFGFKILREGNIPHITDRFVVVSPPCVCFNCHIYELNDGSCPAHDKKDKPVICYSKPTIDQDGNEIYEKDHEWIDMFSALNLIALTEFAPPSNQVGE